MKTYAAIPALLLLLSAADAQAQATFETSLPPNDGRHLRLPEGDIIFFDAIENDPDRTFRQPVPRLVPMPDPGLSIGEMNFRLGGGTSGVHITQYDFGERRFLGGELTGTLDGSKGTIRLRWPNGF